LSQTSSKKPGDETPPAAEPRYPFQEEIENLDKTLAAIHASEDTTKPPHGAERRTAGAGRARESGGVYSLEWEDTGEIAGEPPAHAVVWNLGPDRPSVQVLEARAVADALAAKLRWARAEILELRNQLKGIEQHSDDAKAIKAEVVSALKELVPLAKRNAKRGSPALLRLITRAVKTKL